MTKKERQRQKKELLQEAESLGLAENFYFTTTFHRYCKLLEILDALEIKIREDGALVSKEYVKGRKNLYVNPAVTEYNKTTNIANNTVKSLITIIEAFKEERKADSKLDKFLSE